MKKFIVFLTLFSSFLLANSHDNGIPITLKTYSTNEDISLSDISQYNAKFKTEEQDSRDDEFEVILFESTEESALRQNTLHKFTWIMLELDSNLSSGNYWIEHTNFEFTDHQPIVAKFQARGLH